MVLSDGRKSGVEDKSGVGIPYVQGLSEPITNILRPLRIRVAHGSRSSKWSVCHAIKDSIANEHRKDVVYSVKCDKCDSTCIGETMRTLDARMKEY